MPDTMRCCIRRSKEASHKLAEMGYVNVSGVGGIEDWTGDIVIDE